MNMTLSDKYQVVIPKELRRKHHLKPGQKVHVVENKAGDIVIKTSPEIGELYGALANKKLWGDDPAVSIRKTRDDEWRE